MEKEFLLSILKYAECTYIRATTVLSKYPKTLSNLVPRSSRLARRLLLTSPNKTKRRLEKIKLSRADTCYHKIGCYGMMKITGLHQGAKY